MSLERFAVSQKVERLWLPGDMMTGVHWLSRVLLSHVPAYFLSIDTGPFGVDVDLVVLFEFVQKVPKVGSHFHND